MWLACRGLDVRGVDVSATAISQARDLARRREVGDRCRFDVVDLDTGLPAGPPVDVALCHRFRDRRLDHALIARLAPGGLLATVSSWLSARARRVPRELPAAFTGLDVIAAGEGQGEAWLLARK